MQYHVSINRAPLTVYPARTSAIAFNHVWWGAQRPLEQTEISYFVSFDMDAPVTLEIEVQDADVQTVDIRPREFAIPCTVDGNRITLTLDRPRKFSVEVNGYAQALHVFANPAQDFTPDENTLYFGPGEHDAGVISPKDGQTVYLAEGAVVYGIIYAYKVRDVKILGRGILDSSRFKRGYEVTPDEEPAKTIRDTFGLPLKDLHYYSQLNAYGCDNLYIEGIILRDSPFWTLTTRNDCQNVTIENIKIIGQWRYNADGIDVCNSRHVVIRDCFVRSFDDCIVVRAPHLEGETGGCEDYEICDNVLWCDWGKHLEIWSGKKDSMIRNIRFRRNHLTHTCQTAISIDTWYGAPDIRVEDVLYEDIFIDTNAEPLYPVYQETDDMVYAPDKANFPLSHAIHITVGKLGKPTGEQGCDPNVDTSGYRIAYRNIRFQNLRCTGKRKLPVYINREHLSDLCGIDIEGGDLGATQIR